MRRFLEKYIDKKNIATGLISAFTIFIAGLIWTSYQQSIIGFLRDTLSEWIFNAITFSITLPISVLILIIFLIVFIQKGINKYLVKTNTQITPEWVITTNKSNPQWTEYKELSLDNQNLKSIKLKLKVRSDFMRFGFKFLDQKANVLNNGVLGNDNYILVHVGKQVGSNDLAFVTFKKGVKDLEDTKFSKLNKKSELKMKIKLINKNNFKFYVNGKMIYSSYIETPLRKRLVLLSWGDNKNEYDLIAENINIVTEY